MCWTKLLRPVLTIVIGSVAAVFVVLFHSPAVGHASSPIVTIGYWDPGVQCTTSIVGAWDADSFTRDTLAGEVFSYWSHEALKANAVMIRAGAVYFVNNPEGNYSGLCNQTGYPFSVRTSRYQGWVGGQSAKAIGIGNNIPNDRVTDTGGIILRKNGQLFFPEFNDCIQNYSQQLGLQGRNYVQILTALDGVYGANRPPWVGDPSQCSPPSQIYSNLTVETSYPFVNSMTNGTVPEFLGIGTYYSDSATLPYQAREAEVYWGFGEMDGVQTIDGRLYVRGWHTGDKIEYRMYFGGSYPNLHLIGIADKPAPVEMNVYIDGYYRGKMMWDHNDNARHLNIKTFSGIPYGIHTIALEFSNDAYGGPGLPDLDRNFYLDVLGVTQ